MTISATSTSAGCSIADETAQAIASGAAADLGVLGVVFSSPSVLRFDGELLGQRRSAGH
jgi:hypothetical protein